MTVSVPLPPNSTFCHREPPPLSVSLPAPATRPSPPKEEAVSTSPLTAPIRKVPAPVAYMWLPPLPPK